MGLKYSLATATLLVLSSVCLFGQGDRGAITGVVTDTSGSAVPNVTLEVVNTGTNARFDTSAPVPAPTPRRPAGREYDLTARQPASLLTFNAEFRSRPTRPPPLISAQRRSRYGKRNSPGRRTADSDRIGRRRNGRESKQFLDMPLTLGGGIRNPSNFIKLSPGVSPTGTWTKSISGGGGFQDQIYYDGIALSRGDLSNDAEVNPSVDAIAEFKLITNNYSAEYAHAMGGVTSFTMKSGTNNFTARALSSCATKSWMPADSSRPRALHPNRTNGAAPWADPLFFRSSITARTRRSGSSPSTSSIAAAELLPA